MELMIVIVIIGILSAVGMVMFGDMIEKAKMASTKANSENIKKVLMLEFMKCEIESSALIFNSHSCSNSNPPSTNLIGNYVTSSMNMKNPYSTTSSAISSNPCTLGTVSITSPSKGSYATNIYSTKTQKISSTNIGTIWTPIQTNAKNTWTPVNTGCKNTWKQVQTNAKNTWKKAGP